MFAHHLIKDTVDVLGDALAGAVGQDVSFKEAASSAQQLILFGVIFIEETGVVEVIINPGLEKSELSEVDDKARSVELSTSESQSNRPIMPVDERAVSIVAMLAVSERDLPVGLFAGEHF